MPLPTFNWIDLTNFPTGPENAGRQLWLMARKGNVLYAMLFDRFTGQGDLYQSIDAGLTWTLLDATIPDSNSQGESYLYTGTDGLLRYTTVVFGSTIVFNQFDPANPGAGWAGATNIGGGFIATQGNPSVIDSCALFEYRRSNGDVIVVKQESSNKVRILKNSAGTWTSLALIDDTGVGRVNHVFDAIVDGFGNIHVFGNVYQNSDICDLWHLSVSTADVVSSRHTLETGLEDSGFGTIPVGTDNPMATAAGRPDISANGNLIAYSYAKRGFSGYRAHGTFAANTAEVHIAIGDLSIDPLNPSWTIETVATGTNPGIITFGASVAIACTFKGGNTPSVYFFDGTWNASGSLRKADLKTSDRTAPATWSTPDFVWDHIASPAVNSPVSANVGLDGFDLLNAFTNGVGIMIGLFSGGNVYTGYIGPPITVTGRYTYAYGAQQRYNRSSRT